MQLVVNKIGYANNVQYTQCAGVAFNACSSVGH